MFFGLALPSATPSTPTKNRSRWRTFAREKRRQRTRRCLSFLLPSFLLPVFSAWTCRFRLRESPGSNVQSTSPGVRRSRGPRSPVDAWHSALPPGLRRCADAAREPAQLPAPLAPQRRRVVGSPALLVRLPRLGRRE